jgi:hypothetical protein
MSRDIRDYVDASELRSLYQLSPWRIATAWQSGR